MEHVHLFAGALWKQATQWMARGHAPAWILSGTVAFAGFSAAALTAAPNGQAAHNTVTAVVAAPTQQPYYGGYGHCHHDHDGDGPSGGVGTQP